MDYVNKAASSLNTAIDAVVAYLKENAVAIVGLLAVIYFIRTNVMKNSRLLGGSQGHVLAQESGAARNATSREEELRQVRLRQQELASQRAQEAARLRKEKEEKERERRNHVAKNAKKGGGDKLGGAISGNSNNTETVKKNDDNNGACGYNPMQPWTAHNSGYRPARRSVRRG